MDYFQVKEQLLTFLSEDIGHTDLTSDIIFSNQHVGTAKVIAKKSGVFSGAKLITYVYQLLSDDIQVTLHKNDRDLIKHGDILATISGPVRVILTGERVMLNLIQRMSGIASATYNAIKTLDNSSIRICDTRKTTPGFRLFEKYAVTSGGGFNHRHGLYDGVMIKDNHIAFAGSITKAVNEIKNNLGHMVPIEVETESKEQVKEAVKANVNIIMFDNQTPQAINQLSQLVPAHITTEASGGIHLNNLKQYKNCTVDYISLGFLTHSVHSLDISLTI